MRLGCVLERLESVLEVSWGHLGASWEDLGGVLASLGSFLGAFWEYFWKFLCHLEQHAKIATKQNKMVIFPLIFEVSGRLGALENKKNR